MRVFLKMQKSTINTVSTTDNWTYHRDIIIFYVDAMAINTKIYGDIDELYKTNESAFLSYAKKSPLYNHPLIIGGGLCREVYGKKALGILLYVNKTRSKSVKSALDSVIKKGWPTAHRHIENPDRAEGEKYIMGLKQGLEDAVIENGAEMFIFCSLCIRYQTQIISRKDFTMFLLSLSLRANAYLSNDWKYDYYRKKDNAFREKAGTLKERIFSDYGIKITADGQFSSTDESLRSLHQFFFRLAYADRVVTYYLFKDAGLCKSDIDDVFCACLGAVGDGSDDEAAKMFLSGILVKLLCKTITQLKERYLANPDKADAAKHEKTIGKLTADNTRLENENARLKETISSLEEKLQSSIKDIEKPHLDRIRVLEKEIAKQNEIIQQERYKDRELNALRDFFFSFENRRAAAEAEPGRSQDALMDLKDTAGAIIGGNPKWIARMKSLLPKWVFISSAGFDKRSLDGIQTICFLPNHMSHKLYYKAVAIAKNKKMDIGFIYSQNEHLALKEIAKVLVSARE